MTEAQWPTLPMPSDEQERDPREPANVEYTLLVEQLVGSGNTMRWLAEPVTQQTWRARDRARREAERCAWVFRPRHPMSEQRRSVYRVSPDEYLTIIEGATQTFSYRTLVAEPLGYLTAR
ncbi:hypothetical protein [Micropruina sonneratiae]|uniref:hypothetical protein n=1 Tax=Micropruina sonneratiae TaxID=2986940 RepID=UPI0022262173|nr:hypothetical protein [Micropruina sp. KQZ13P-5]MCW3156794.1 hypothetical protein [Micropruina sp. KQZ13P-5]